MKKEDNVSDSKASNKTGAVVVQTLVVRLKNQNKKVNARAIIDTGSERTYLTEGVIKFFGYIRTSKVKLIHKLIHKLFGGVETKHKLHHQYKLKVISIDKVLMCMNENVICSNIRKVPNGHWIHEQRQYGITISDLEDSGLNVASEIKCRPI